MMDGVWSAKTLVTEYLNSDIPDRLVGFRNHWQLDDYVLPDPRMIIQWEPLALDHWPTFITLSTGMQDMIREDYTEAGDPKYRVRYAMRTYVWVRTEEAGPTTQMRDNLTTVVRDALTDHPALRSLETWEHCEPYIDEGTIREEYSDLTVIKGDRFLAGAYVAYDMTVTEIVTREPLTETLALQFGVEVFQIPKIPNAPTSVLALPDEDVLVPVVDGRVHLKWKSPTWFGGIYPIDYYQVEMKTNNDDWVMLEADTGNTHPRLVIEGLDSSNSYQFRVAAWNRIGVGAISAPSNVVSPN